MIVTAAISSRRGPRHNPRPMARKPIASAAPAPETPPPAAQDALGSADDWLGGEGEQQGESAPEAGEGAPPLEVPAAESETEAVPAAELAKSPGPARAPYSKKPLLRVDHERLIESIFEPRIDIVAEYKELRDALDFREALTNEAIKKEMARVENFALRAHRLWVVIKTDTDAFKVDVEIAKGAMRETAQAELSAEKKAKTREKQITEADVDGRAAANYPDEWRDISERFEKAKRFSDHAERLADLWKARSYTLAAMIGGR